MTEPVHRTTPVSTVSARVKFTHLERRPADVLVQRRDEGEAHRRVHERHRETGMDDPDRVVVVLGGLARTSHAPVRASTRRKPSVCAVGGGSSPEAIICMSSSPERPAIVSRSAADRPTSTCASARSPRRRYRPTACSPACLADWPAREARPARGRLRSPARPTIPATARHRVPVAGGRESCASRTSTRARRLRREPRGKNDEMDDPCGTRAHRSLPGGSSPDRRVGRMRGAPTAPAGRRPAFPTRGRARRHERQARTGVVRGRVPGRSDDAASQARTSAHACRGAIRAQGSRAALEPATARRRGDHVPEAVGDVGCTVPRPGSPPDRRLGGAQQEVDPPGR